MAMQKAFDTNILVQVDPVNTFSTSDEAPVVSFCNGTVVESRIPCERDRDCSAIDEVNCERVCRYFHRLSFCVSLLDFQSTHSSSLTSLNVLLDQSLNSIDFSPRKAAAALKPHRVKPVLSDIVITFNVHVRRLLSIASIEEKPIRTQSQNRRHAGVSLQQGT
jgi:hypothetical protein